MWGKLATAGCLHNIAPQVELDSAPLLPIRAQVYSLAYNADQSPSDGSLSGLKHRCTRELILCRYASLHRTVCVSGIGVIIHDPSVGTTLALEKRSATVVPVLYHSRSHKLKSHRLNRGITGSETKIKLQGGTERRRARESLPRAKPLLSPKTAVQIIWRALAGDHVRSAENQSFTTAVLATNQSTTLYSTSMVKTVHLKPQSGDHLA